MNNAQSSAEHSPFTQLLELQEQVLLNRFEMPEAQAQIESWNGVGFTLNNQQFVVQIGEVTEILPVPSTTPLPGVQPWAKGVSNVRGRLLPIVDLGEFLGKERTTTQSSNRIMVVERDDLSVGLIVDDVQGMIQFTERDFSRQLPDQLSESVKPFSSGCYKKEVEYVVFSTNRLVANSSFLKAAKDTF